MGQVQIRLSTSTSLNEECNGNSKWPLFLFSSIIAWIGGLILILLWRFCWSAVFGEISANIQNKVFGRSFFYDEEKQTPSKKFDFEWTRLIRDYAGFVVSPYTDIGRLLMLVNYAVNLAAVALYIYNACFNQIESCVKWTDDQVEQANFAFNMFFLVYFIIRFLASKNKISFWFDIFTFVDVFTIPNSIVAIAISRTWNGLKFLRILLFLELPSILIYCKILKTSNTINLCQIFINFLTIWLFFAGFIHIIENTANTYNPITYLQALYFLVVTMSTVGYGDINPKSTIGRLFVIVFIVIGAIFFANILPKIVEIVENRPQFSGSYDNEDSTK